MIPLELSGISKRFGSVQALDGVDFAVPAGEVHALLGENGAGKSTLMRIADGMIAPDSGVIRVHGRDTAIRSPRHARALGIGMVHQHFASIGRLSVAENIALAVGTLSGGRAGGRMEHTAWSGLMQSLPLSAPAETLSVAQRQRLEIVRALASGASILLLDEPSAVLAPREVDELLALVRSFVATGGAAVLITHKLREVLLAADRVTVLRKGRVTLRAPVAGQTEASLAEAMIGRSANKPGREGPATVRAGPDVIRDRAPIAYLAGLPIHPGELIGIAAIEGNGHRELLGAVIAADARVAIVPEDRSTDGLIPSLSVTENVVLGQDQDPRWAHGIRLIWSAARSRTAELLQDFRIAAPSPDAAAATLSGGNQQKLVLARALERGPRLLVAENPTRGLDIQAGLEIHERLRAAARDGVAVIVYSADLDEVLELADRVLVVYRGSAREAPPGADRRVVGDMMLGIGER